VQHGDEGVQLGIQRVDSGQAQIDQIDRGDTAGADIVRDRARRARERRQG